MIPNSYHHGSLARIEVEFRDADRVLTTPSVVTAHYANPAGTVTNLTYGVDVALVLDDVGKYHVDITCNRVGQWQYRFKGDSFAEEGHFIVIPSLFSP